MSSNKVYFYRNWIGFFILGTINNLPYVVVNSSAKVLSTSFGQANLVTLVMFSNVALGFVAKGANTLISTTSFPFWIRFIFNGCLMAAGLTGVILAPNFWIALASIVLTGMSSSFGENLTLGFLSKFSKEHINAWSSGTGMAGVVGAVLYIALSCIAEVTVVSGNHGNTVIDPDSTDYASKLKKINRFVFIGTLPIIVLYWGAYFILIKAPPAVKESNNEETQPLQIQDKVSNNDPGVVAAASGEGSFKRILRCLKLSSWLIFNMIFVYFFEYTCRGFAAKSRPEEEFSISELQCPELYASLQLCYQAGVFVSRSSVQLFQIRQIHIFTLFQLINMIVWILQAWWKFLPVYVLPSYMVFVGLLGGASYVNIFYLLRTDEKYPSSDRELCTNLVGMSISIGILLGTGLPIPLFKTIFADK
ncbi:PREDICTED: battenin-like [Amphimedon queenslandica]|uniref:Battenin n=1 Tax=Amphimedon queenslandica TaxID=400682 RepID=A0A1X7UL72_AMPQE|nr:PREDICTED: battenin-like [Amphimedon queenslandica]|eukprot:XP_019853585.1 PREDICTED: battenin-like [Amphimedon queenslandica]